MARVPEKLKELAAVTTDPCSIIHLKRRLSLTTHLMQMLFQPLPANVVAEDAITHCDVVAYYGCKLALGGACGLYASAGKNMASKSRSDQDLIKVIEGFMERSKRLEDNFLRLEKKRSFILDVIMGLQRLERSSFLNRYAKYHTRKPTVRGCTPSSAMPKLYPQRDVKAISMPMAVPEAQDCLFL
ncbi:uncharacterized protein LOC143543010 [Bidens hawaiensis]|uniref:uncharacterized protein LOC143543010 n=1 Tax=Bidens hawaiensis TaxID=980011 RepID=UPI00404A379A